MPIDNAALLSFVNESVRPVGDRLGGLLPLPVAVLDAAVGKGFPELLGTTAAKLVRPQPWTDADYAEIPVEEVAGSDGGGRTTLTNHDVIGVLRVLAAVKAMIDLNPALGPLIGKVAVNPRA